MSIFNNGMLARELRKRIVAPTKVIGYIEVMDAEVLRFYNVNNLDAEERVTMQDRSADDSDPLLAITAGTLASLRHLGSRMLGVQVDCLTYALQQSISNKFSQVFGKTPDDDDDLARSMSDIAWHIICNYVAIGICNGLNHGEINVATYEAYTWKVSLTLLIDIIMADDFGELQDILERERY